MGNDYQSICDFGQELSEVLNNPTLHKKFRYNTLLLIRKHFDIQHASFVLHDSKYKSNTMKLYLDNVTIGLSTEMFSEYYQHYQKLNPFVVCKYTDNVVDLHQLIPEEEFIETQYYKEFYSKYEVYYQVLLRIQKEGETVAHLSLGRRKEQGPFTSSDLNDLERIRRIIETELLKALRFKELHLEVTVLREHANVFPKAQIVLDKNYNVTYFNEYAPSAVEELTGSDIAFFKYFFVNEIIDNDETFLYLDNQIIEINNFLVKVTKHTHDIRSEVSRNNVNYIIYITRKIKHQVLSTVSEDYYNSLTPREREVVQLIRRGYSNNEIGEALTISPFTVKTHVQKIYSKCNARNRIELINNLFLE